jgi:DNA-binding response OmpR family regulator
VSDHVTKSAPDQTVLVVEDDPAIGNMLSTLLAVEGYRPVLVVDGLEGLETARALRPALITLDLSLPTLDGIQILERLDEGAEERTPVIIVSAYTDRLTAAHRARVSAILTKPFEIDTLLSCISAALRGVSSRPSTPGEPRTD